MKNLLFFLFLLMLLANGCIHPETPQKRTYDLVSNDIHCKLNGKYYNNGFFKFKVLKGSLQDTLQMEIYFEPIPPDRQDYLTFKFKLLNTSVKTLTDITLLGNKNFDLAGINEVELFKDSNNKEKAKSGTLSIYQIQSYQINSFVDYTTPENYYLLKGGFEFLTDGYNVKEGSIEIYINRNNFSSK